MKVKTISRSSSSTQRENKSDLRIHHRNIQPKYHPHAREREYTRAVVATKLTNMFAKPFIGSFAEGHIDGINCSAFHKKHLSPFVSGGADGEVRIWDVTLRKCVGKVPGAHNGLVNGIVFGANNSFLSCGGDGVVKQWSLPVRGKDSTLLESWSPSTRVTMTSIDHSPDDQLFATASSEAVEIWSYNRSSPLQTHAPSSFHWGDATINAVRYNPAQSNLIGFTSSDRGVGLLDTRTSQPLSKTILAMSSNAIEWNPMEPMNFVVANEDHNLYGFDMRKLTQASHKYQGHVGPVLTLSFSPTGREFVSGGYDCTLRLFPTGRHYSRDMYHLKRMQIIRSAHYTLDNNYLLSCSDDANIRLFKAHASKPLGQMTAREEKSNKYRNSVKQKFQHTKEIQQINHTRVRMPKYIKKSESIRLIQEESKERKFENVKKHSRPGTIKEKDSRKDVVVKKVD